jgi:hypothetical protein
MWLLKVFLSEVREAVARTQSQNINNQLFAVYKFRLFPIDAGTGICGPGG